MNGADLKRFAPFAELSEEELAMVSDLVEARELGMGEIVVEEGDEADGLVLVALGSLLLSSARVGELVTLPAGRHLGGTSLAALGRRELTAAAAEASRVLLFPRSAFLRLSDDAPRAATRILEAILRDLASTLRSGLDRLI